MKRQRGKRRKRQKGLKGLKGLKRLKDLIGHRGVRVLIPAVKNGCTEFTWSILFLICGTRMLRLAYSYPLATAQQSRRYNLSSTLHFFMGPLFASAEATLRRR